MATDQVEQLEATPDRGRRVIAAVAVVVLAGGVAALGYLVGQASAPTRSEVAEARREARLAALREPAEASFDAGRTRGKTEGAKVGREKGRKLGKRRGARAAVEEFSASAASTGRSQNEATGSTWGRLSRRSRPGGNQGLRPPGRRGFRVRG